MLRCILFGNMCSGKTSVGQLLAHALGFHVVSAKDAIAANLASATDEVRGLRARGYLLPDPVITTWVMSAVAERVARGEQVIVDGFPRTSAQARTLVDAHGTTSPVIYCDFPEAVLARRFAGRVLCDDCQMPSNTTFEDFDGRCMLCDGESFKPRETDRPDYMAVKTAQFHAESTSVLPVFDAAGMTYLSVRDHARQADLQAEVMELAREFGGAR